MITIPLMAIINAWWGQREGNALPKWVAGMAVFIGAYAISLDWIFSLIWGAGYLVFRFPSLSRVGFAAFHGRPISKIDAEYWWRGRSTLLAWTFVALYFMSANSDLFIAAWGVMGVGAVYSTVGAFGDRPYSARLAEYLSGGWIGVLVYLTSAMV